MTKKKEAKRQIEIKFTVLDIIKGLLCCLLAYLFLMFLFAIAQVVFDKIQIENPLFVIMSVAVIIILVVLE
jgi:hypothetical protein